MSDIDQKPRPRAFPIHSPMFVDGCRLDTLVMGSDGEKVRPYLAVIITPHLLDMPHFSFKLPASVDASFRELADAMRDTLGGEK